MLQSTLVTNDDGTATVTVFLPGHPRPLIAPSDHPNFNRIVTLLTTDMVLDMDSSEKIVSLFDVTQAIATKFESLSERVSVADGRVYLDGDEMHNSLTNQILRFMDEGNDDWRPLVKFYENLLANPNEHSREMLYEWLDIHDFTITDDGMIVGYKGVQDDGEGGYKSISAGPAIVDGVSMNGYIPNNIGSTIQMPRDDVQFDPSNGCSTGLHVGTYAYASGFSRGTVLEVHVNPRDVVSVPTDCSHQKMRTCRYKVVKAIAAPYSSTVLEQDEPEDDDFEGLQINSFFYNV